MSILWRIVRIGLVSYLLILLLMLFFEESLVFFPTRFSGKNWLPPGLPAEEARFTASDGTRLHGVFVEHPRPRAHILFAHGNGGDLTHRLPVLRILHDRMQASVFLFDYRGYGQSEGKPREAGILQDARAARAWLAQRAGINQRDIVLMGRSLGTGVVTDLAAKDGARGLILQSAFPSLPEVAALHYPWLPVRLLMRTRLDSKNKITAYDGPVLQCHGEADQLIPIALGQKLFESIPDPDKQWVTLAGAGHNDDCPMSYYQEMDTFFERLDPKSRSNGDGEQESDR